MVAGVIGLGTTIASDGVGSSATPSRYLKQTSHDQD